MNENHGPFLTNPFVAKVGRWGLLAWSLIGMVILVGLFFRFVLYPIRAVFPPLLVALIVIYLLNPIVTGLERRGLARIWGALLTYLVFLAVVGVALAVLIPAVGDQVASFSSRVPELLSRAQGWLADLSTRLGLHLNVQDLIAPFQPQGGSAASFLSRLTSLTAGVFHLAFVLILGALLAFYLLVDLPKLRRGVQALVPADRRQEVYAVAGQAGATLGNFFRGQLLVACLVGVAATLGFYIIGLPFPALIGALTGLFALVPLIGSLIAAIPALFVAFATTGPTDGLLHVRGGWPLAVAATVVLVGVQQLDARVLSPRFLHSSVRLHPVTVLLSLLVGGTLIGLWGMLLAVPTVAVIKVVGLYVWDTRATWPPRPPSAPLGGPEGAESPAANGPVEDGVDGIDKTEPVGSLRQVDVLGER